MTTDKYDVDAILDGLANTNNIDYILLSGPQGTGKTTWGYRLGEKLGLPCYNFTFNKNTSASDLLGMWQVKNGSFD